ncbi:MAG: hypothetical protein AB7K24_30075 [Gemmataceae bacterium]
MKKLFVSSALLMLLAAPLVRADVPAPRPQGKLVIMVDANTKSPRLVVPKQLLNADRRRGDAGMLHTMMAGLALALAFTGGGIWMVRQRRGGHGTALAIVACLALLSLGTALWADGAVEPRPAPLASFDNTTVFVVERGDAIQLYISPADLAKLTQKK